MRGFFKVDVSVKVTGLVGLVRSQACFDALCDAICEGESLTAVARGARAVLRAVRMRQSEKKALKAMTRA